MLKLKVITQKVKMNYVFNHYGYETISKRKTGVIYKLKFTLTFVLFWSVLKKILFI